MYGPGGGNAVAHGAAGASAVGHGAASAGAVAHGPTNSTAALHVTAPSRVRVTCSSYAGQQIEGELQETEGGRLVIRCDCHAAQMSLTRFTQHAGREDRNPGTTIFVEGKTLAHQPSSRLKTSPLHCECHLPLLSLRLTRPLPPCFLHATRILLHPPFTLTTQTTACNRPT
ncbi:unnamed protein product [Closterium sp. Naga37s-1]|nr:unnamed protein product [Closterium sp. Naga37s-1]